MTVLSSSIFRQSNMRFTNTATSGQTLVANGDGTATWTDVATAPPEPEIQVILLASNVSNPRQGDMQILYDNATGSAAPDVPPTAVDDATSDVSGYVIYLGHSTWSYKSGSGTWQSFSGPKGNFDATVSRIYTYK